MSQIVMSHELNWKSGIMKVAYTAFVVLLVATTIMYFKTYRASNTPINSSIYTSLAK